MTDDPVFPNKSPFGVGEVQQPGTQTIQCRPKNTTETVETIPHSIGRNETTPPASRFSTVIGKLNFSGRLLRALLFKNWLYKATLAGNGCAHGARTHPWMIRSPGLWVGKPPGSPSPPVSLAVYCPAADTSERHCIAA